jgi:hypothetical protein
MKVERNILSGLVYCMRFIEFTLRIYVISGN